MILISQYKTEMVGVICQAYEKYMQQKMTINFADTIAYMNKSEQKGHVAANRQVYFHENWQLVEAAMYVQSETELVAHCPSGLDFARVQQIDVEREKRRAVARDRFQKEQDVQRAKDAESEKLREEERKKLVAARKKSREEEEKKMAAEEEERERARAVWLLAIFSPPQRIHAKSWIPELSLTFKLNQLNTLHHFHSKELNTYFQTLTQKHHRRGRQETQPSLRRNRTEVAAAGLLGAAKGSKPIPPLFVSKKKNFPPFPSKKMLLSAHGVPPHFFSFYDSPQLTAGKCTKIMILYFGRRGKTTLLPTKVGT